MAGTIDSLYLKYCNRVQRFLENDAYYQYLLDLISSGKTVITQHNRVLDKTVDEKWLVAIEETIPAIHEIILHPRRFLKTIENILPVEQVKRVGNDTVRHLASHTQYIHGVQDDGTIAPSRLLTVENEESLDFYENRFLNTLIQKLGEFIEKRVTAIFWDTGDEESSNLKMESSVEDDYESIDYKLEMIVHNKQTYLENDGSKMEIFKRIDRVRRIVSDFRASVFCQVMSETAPVRSPIQRTNQIIKNPSYRRCYDLWQFLERYDDVGYTIDVRETALDFDEDYLFQMYGNLALNYTVFKSLLAKDSRRITEQPKRRKTIKPKFVKQIVEEFVDDYDIPDVEIRRVIVEEVTKAQLEIERRTQEREEAQKLQAEVKKKERLAKEREKEKARKLQEAAKEKERLAKQREREREKARREREAAKEKERLAKQREREREKARREREAAKAVTAPKKRKAVPSRKEVEDQQMRKAAAAKNQASENTSQSPDPPKTNSVRENSEIMPVNEELAGMDVRSTTEEEITSFPEGIMEAGAPSSNETIAAASGEGSLPAPPDVPGEIEAALETVREAVDGIFGRMEIASESEVSNSAESSALSFDQESTADAVSAPSNEVKTAPADPSARGTVTGWLRRIRRGGKPDRK